MLSSNREEGSLRVEFWGVNIEVGMYILISFWFLHGLGWRNQDAWNGLLDINEL